MPESNNIYEGLAERLRCLAEEIDRLAPAVEDLFREATKRYEPPTTSSCRSMALYLIALRNHRRKRIKKPRIVKTGERFLKELAAERKEPEYWLSFTSEELFAGRRQKYQELLDRIDQTRQRIEALLPCLWLEDTEPDPIRRIAEVATEAWTKANRGRAPRSTNEDDPLCKFVEAALAEIGQRVSQAEISDVLRGRRRKRKEGPNL